MVLVWTKQSTSDEENSNWNSICFGTPESSPAGLFVAVAKNTTAPNNLIMRSSNGINWIGQQSPVVFDIETETVTATTWNSICFGNNLFVAVSFNGQYYDRNVMTSPDGINWTIRNTGLGNYGIWTSVCFATLADGSYLFVAVGFYFVGTPDNRVITSPDGINWTYSAAANVNSWQSVCFGNGLFVAVAAKLGFFDTTSFLVATSQDGKNWESYDPGTNLQLEWTSICFGTPTGLFVAVAKSGTTSRVMTSPNGSTWTIGNAPYTSSWKSVCYSNGLYVAVADTGDAKIMTSSDGINWSLQEDSNYNTALNSVCNGNNLFVTVGLGANADRVITASSTATIVITTQPISQNLAIGSSVTFTVVATGESLSYQWYFNTNPIPEATQSTYTKITTAGDAGPYYVQITNSSNQVLDSDIATLNLIDITTQPSSQNAVIGDSVTFDVDAIGAESYQWNFDEQPILGATGSTYGIVVTTATDAGTYDALITNEFGQVFKSDTATLNLINITTQPISQFVAIGTSVTFTVVATGETNHMFIYQWYFNGQPISRATQSTYIISSTTVSNVGTYYVQITNLLNQVFKSDNANLNLLTLQPSSQNVKIGSPVTFIVAATGISLSYQWYFNSQLIPGKIESTYTIPITTAADVGTYYVIISNGSETLESANATLGILDITTQPISQFLSIGNPVTFTVVATGNSLSYQWYLNTQPISGARQSTYSILSTAASNAGTYYVIIKANLLNEFQSDNATLNLITSLIDYVSDISQTLMIDPYGPNRGSVTYKWFQNLNGATNPDGTIVWTEIPNTTNTLTTPARTGVLVYKYKVESTLNTKTITNISTISCYLKNTKILCLINGKEKYVKIQNIKKGDFVKTYKKGYKTVISIGNQKIINDPNNQLNCLYKMKGEKLTITGGHSILVSKIDSELKTIHKEFYNQNNKIKDKYLLLACDSDLFEPIKDQNEYEIFHILLNSKNKNKHYGIYADGVLSESISENEYLKNFKL